jgi:cytochrome c oxidase assembly factor CtaG
VPALPVALLALIGAPAVALGHGLVTGPPDASTLLTGWSLDIQVWLPILLVAWAWLAAVRRVDGAHPGNPVPRRRSAAWLGGLAVLVLALESPLALYDTTLFTAHMLQHLLLTLVAAPLLVLAGPITLLLRVSTPEVRKRWILPVLHSRLVSFVGHPLVAWLIFMAVMWGSHFSHLFDASLEDPTIHELEHGLFLVAAMLFWWPVMGVDPAPHRLPHPARIGYLALGMPFSSFLGLAIFSAGTVLYHHYATLHRTWGQSAITDQGWAGGIMWAGGDLVFLIGLLLAVGAWLRAEEAEGHRIDQQLDREQATRDRASTPAVAMDRAATPAAATDRAATPAVAAGPANSE